MRYVCRYVDGTFKVVKHPFKQLFTINAFVKNEGAIKQLPFVYVIMTRHTKKDYIAVRT